VNKLLVMAVSDEFEAHLKEVSAQERAYLSDDQGESANDNLTYGWECLEGALSLPYAGDLLGRLLNLAEYARDSSQGALLDDADHSAIAWASAYCYPKGERPKPRSALVAEDVFDFSDFFRRRVPIHVRVGQIDHETSQKLHGEHYSKEWWVQLLDCEDTAEHGADAINGMTEYVKQAWEAVPRMLPSSLRTQFPKEPIAILWLDASADVVRPSWAYYPTGPRRGWYAASTSFSYLHPELAEAVTGEPKPANDFPDDD
jgi:hypothetical protein